MRALIVLSFFALLNVAYSWPARNTQHVLQAPSAAFEVAETAQRQLHGRFLHITDLHPDQFYKIHSSTEEGIACHRDSGPAGIYGAETSDCDSPFALINETFKWIENNLRDKVDFVVWTGDSARHDSDEEIPRSAEQVLGLNRYIAEKFIDVFGNGRDESDPTKDLSIPIVPTFGNNDILPHNILLPGPNRWLQEYADVWRDFIPEEQRHSFQRGGWFWVEVIPQKLAVFSLNTLYFFDHNTAVDGCGLRSEPGWEQMEWLRIQLQFMRERGLKAILTGHVPPARTDSKQLWDETCWQKYTLWLQQFRDVVVSGIYGHMNIDHFLLQDTKDVDLAMFEDLEAEVSTRAHLDDELTIYSAADYLEELRDTWSSLPNPSLANPKNAGVEKKKGKDSKRDKALKEIGGPWGERFQLSTVGPSVVPNFFPTLRVIEYNITGLESHPIWTSQSKACQKGSDCSLENRLLAYVNDPEEYINDPDMERWLDSEELTENLDLENLDVENEVSASKKEKKHKKPRALEDPNLHIPPPPSKSSPPGPAYSPQTLTLLGYTQYFANLTRINNDFINSTDEDADTEGWHGGKHKDKHPKKEKPQPKEFKYEVEYSTFNDSLFKLHDMTVKSYLKLAHRIGQYKPRKGDDEDDYDDTEDGETQPSEKSILLSDFSDFVNFLGRSFRQYANIVNAWQTGQPLGEYLTSCESCDDSQEMGKTGKGHKKGHNKKKGHKKRNKNKAWLAFIKRAFVGTLDDGEIQDFQMARDNAVVMAGED